MVVMTHRMRGGTIKRKIVLPFGYSIKLDVSVKTTIPIRLLVQIREGIRDDGEWLHLLSVTMDLNLGKSLATTLLSTRMKQNYSTQKQSTSHQCTKSR